MPHNDIGVTFLCQYSIEFSLSALEQDKLLAFGILSNPINSTFSSVLEQDRLLSFGILCNLIIS